MISIIALVIGFFAGMFWIKYKNSKIVKLLKEQLNNALTLLKDQENKVSLIQKDVNTLTHENNQLRNEKFTFEKMAIAKEEDKLTALDVEKGSVLDHTPSVEEKKMVFVKIFQDEDECYRWNKKEKNNKIIAESGEGYTSMQNLEKAINIVRDAFLSGDYKVKK